MFCIEFGQRDCLARQVVPTQTNKSNIRRTHQVFPQHIQTMTNMCLNLFFSSIERPFRLGNVVAIVPVQRFAEEILEPSERTTQHMNLPGNEVDEWLQD